ncbi:helix-turn-helix domain-containing protein [Allomuricauda sp. F6463D]|uniref:helix-turn-helix domain-containing protein n=1 Tax=Allomuricauda sp. F6463D TaxID=2926409 RepID=UPI001FF43F14|nr:helix-turn-helix domain-containing protein [Muricauda sp. F6463D]MCK0159054.1 helix-turn-helix domain-containing protein [Muricauda sp. F6463D]
MGATIVTTKDLMEFKLELLEDIKTLLEHNSGTANKKWLRSKEVRKLLGISPGTLQNLRVNGTLPFTRIGGVLYYEQGEIQEVLEQNKVHNRI